jgi:hypothetical protein
MIPKVKIPETLIELGHRWIGTVIDLFIFG